MKKLLNTLVVACALQIASIPVLEAASLSEKVKASQTKPAKLNINTATQAELQSLPGIGAKKADAIITYRSSVGKFSSVAQLRNVKGIGDKMLVKLTAVAEAK
jgi:competence protein ComEA